LRRRLVARSPLRLAARQVPAQGLGLALAPSRHGVIAPGFPHFVVLGHSGMSPVLPSAIAQGANLRQSRGIQTVDHGGNGVLPSAPVQEKANRISPRGDALSRCKGRQIGLPSPGMHGTFRAVSSA
jgi:hypothetical protein